MTYPIIGPSYSSLGVNQLGTQSWRRQKWRYRQAKPYDLPLPYRAVLEDITTAIALEPGLGGEIPAHANAFVGSNLQYERGAPLDFSNDRAVITAVNGARKRFVNEVSEFANVALSLLERKQTMDLLTQRSLQLVKWANAVRRGRFGDAARSLGLERRQSKGIRQPSRELSNAWLQWWFGISPLVKDMSSAMKILDSPFGDRPVVARFRFREAIPYVVRNDGSFGYVRIVGSNVKDVRVRVQAVVRIDNPNLFLASRMGFTNPLVLAYEAIPFSFIANWFVNIEEYLSQWSDFHGLTLMNAFHTIRVDHQGSATRLTKLYDEFWYPRPFGYQIAGRSSEVRRILGIPSVQLGVRPPWRLSASRAATAVALLVQKFVK